jgi:hypothetical protein
MGCLLFDDPNFCPANGGAAKGLQQSFNRSDRQYKHFPYVAEFESDPQAIIYS